MKIAIIGTGISGNVIARLLCADHDIHVFEAGSHIGGHAQTVDVNVCGEKYGVDVGFMVFNERTYPNFCRLLSMLNVDAQDSDMSFSVRCEESGLEYSGSGFNGIFAQRRNLFRPSFYKMLKDILRFNRVAGVVLDDLGNQTLREFLVANRYGRWFVEKYLVPMAAAIWSCPPNELLDFPAHFLVAFFRNHGLMQLRDRPQWKTIDQRSRNYVRELTKPFRDRINVNCPIEHVLRHDDHVVVKPKDASSEIFDKVIFATHADQTLSILKDANKNEHSILSAFPYQLNTAVLHTDMKMLPQRHRAWASWNYRIPKFGNHPVTVTYDLSRLQSVDSPSPILLTLNDRGGVKPESILREFEFHHPRYTQQTLNAQRRCHEINGHNRTYFCGAYWGYGFHEDGVNSALAVGRYFGKSLETCKVASTKEASTINASRR